MNANWGGGLGKTWILLHRCLSALCEQVQLTKEKRKAKLTKHRRKVAPAAARRAYVRICTKLHTIVPVQEPPHPNHIHEKDVMGSNHRGGGAFGRKITA